MKRKEPTDRMLEVRHLRMKGYTYQQIGRMLKPKITKQGVRFILLRSDEYYDLKLGTYNHFRKYKKRMKLNVKRKASLQSSEAFAS